jgi:hypothetical protein
MTPELLKELMDASDQARRVTGRTFIEASCVDDLKGRYEVRRHLDGILADRIADYRELTSGSCVGWYWGRLPRELGPELSERHQ